MTTEALFKTDELQALYEDERLDGYNLIAKQFSVFAIVDLILYLGGLPRPPRPRRRRTFAGAAS